MEKVYNTMNICELRDLLDTISEESPQGDNQEVSFLDRDSDSSFVITDVVPKLGIIEVEVETQIIYIDNTELPY